MPVFELGNGKRLVVLRGDITRVRGFEAVVNPANSQLLMGGGVAGAIRRAGGQSIEDEARKHAPIPVGEAVLTSAGRLKADYVIHAPTMELPAMRTTPLKVREATKAALRLAEASGIGSVLFPGMGTGVGGVEPELAAEVMVEEIIKFLKKSDRLKNVGLIAYTDELFRAFIKAVRETLTSS